MSRPQTERRWARTASWFNSWVDVIAPPVCVVCGDPAGTALALVCRRCLTRVRARRRRTWIPLPWNTPGGPDLTHEGENSPRPRHPRMLEVHTAHDYEPPLGELLRGLKYDGMHHLAEILARRAAPVLGAWPGRPRLVPIPLHPARFKARGFNQAELLARHLAATLEAAPPMALLERRHDTPSQTRLDRNQRQSNLQGAFRAQRRLDGQKLLLVDDVITTGSTLAAAAAAALEGGGVVVGAVALARTPAGCHGSCAQSAPAQWARPI